MRCLRTVGRRNDMALQCLAAAMWCLTRHEEARAQLLESDCIETLASAPPLPFSPGLPFCLHALARSRRPARRAPLPAH